MTFNVDELYIAMQFTWVECTECRFDVWIVVTASLHLKRGSCLSVVSVI